MGMLCPAAALSVSQVLTLSLVSAHSSLQGGSGSTVTESAGLSHREADVGVHQGATGRNGLARQRSSCLGTALTSWCFLRHTICCQLPFATCKETKLWFSQFNICMS
jgi:hypothetical protein